jgi:hypothetical protein
MAYKDGENFTTYCDEPYDRHLYKVVLKNGKALIFDDYEIARAFWWNNNQTGNLRTIEVIDKSGEGF